MGCFLPHSAVRAVPRDVRDVRRRRRARLPQLLRAALTHSQLADDWRQGRVPRLRRRC
jgi:hypothetical protein